MEQILSNTVRLRQQNTYEGGDWEGDSPLEIVRAGDHWSLRMSRQMEPFELMLG